MNNRLKTIVDLEKYPIQNLNSPIIKELINKCKSELDQFSCSTIPNFILPKSLKIMNTELEKQVDEVYMSKESINPYLNSKDEPSLEKDHPKRIFSNRYNGYLNSDLFEKDSEMKFLYEREELLKFVSACVGVSPIYRWADPLACHAYNIMKPDGVLPWHFDSCEFTLSIMILAIINGLITSIILETLILIKQMKFSNALKTALGMSLISMISMEIAMNSIDWIFTGGAILNIWIVPIMFIAGFSVAWPYNYWRLKKFGIICH